MAAGVGPVNVQLTPGFEIGTTSLNVYFEIPASDEANSFLIAIFSDDFGDDHDITDQFPLPGFACRQRPGYCVTLLGGDFFGALLPGHTYFVIVEAFGNAYTGGHADSALSTGAVAAFTPGPPALPVAQTFGAGLDNVSGRTGPAQVLRGEPVNTATGAYATRSVDLSMSGLGVEFEAARSYSSNDTSAGLLGPGWSWSYDLGLTVAAGGNVTLRAEDGSDSVYIRQSSGVFTAPPGARSTLASVTGGFRLVTPDQRVLSFDSTGRLTSFVDARAHGLSFAYTAGVLSSVTDGAGRVVAVTVTGDGRLSRVTLPDGRFVEYGYTTGRLSSYRDPTGAITRYGYDAGGRLATVTDANNHVSITNTYNSAGRVDTQRDALGRMTSYVWNPTTQLATTIDPDGKVNFDQYLNNVLVGSQNGNGDTQFYRYDSRLNLVLVVDPLDGRYAVTYDGAGNALSRAASYLALTERSTYNARNDPLTQVDGRGNTTTFSYDPAGSVLTVRDPTNPAGPATASYTYNPQGLVATSTDARGKVATYGYDAAGNRTSVTLPSGARTTYGYDATGRLTSMVDPRGNAAGADPAAFRTTYGYDAADRLTAVTDPLGHTTTTGYDPAGNKVSTADGAGNETVYSYDAANRLTQTRDPAGRTTTTAYTPAGRVASTTDGAGGVTTYQYNVAGRLASTVSPRGNVPGATAANFTTSYGYDWNGNQTSVSHPYPGGGTATTSTRYDPLNRPIAVTDPLGRTTTTGYDSDGNVTLVIDPLNNRTSHTYDLADRPLTSTDERGKTTVLSYDPAGNLLSQTTPLGEKTTWTYDDDGRVASVVDPRGNATGATPATFTTRYGYDLAGHLATVTDPLSHPTSTTFDAAGRTTTRTDAAGHTTGYSYDAADRLTAVTGPDATGATQATTYAYDPAGLLTGRTDPLGHTTGYGYDAAGRLATVTDPLGRRRTYGYDPDGHATTTVTARGNAAAQPGGTPTAAAGTITASYDILGRLVGRDLGGAQQFTFGYDAADRQVSATDPAGTETRGYDDADRLLAVTRGTDTFSYTYDPAGNVTSRTYPGGAAATTTATATYDDDGRQVSLTDGGATTTFGYDQAGNLTGTTLPAANGYTTTRSYDPAGRSTTVATTRAAATPTAPATLSRYDLTLDAVGNPTRVTTTRGTTAARTDSYTYDPADRLTAYCPAASTCAGAATALRYSYDLVGNRLTQTRTGGPSPGTTTYSYDNADPLTAAAVTGAATTTYGYDADGNQTTAGTRTTTYTLDNRLATTTAGGATTAYGYDAGGNRISATTAGVPTTYRWDINNPLPLLAAERTGTGRPQVYRYDPTGQPLSLLPGRRISPIPTPGRDGGAAAAPDRPAGPPISPGLARSYYATDWLGSVTDLTGAGGTPTHAYTYQPFGETSTAAAVGAATNPLRFAGQYLDPVTGQYNLRARQYDPATGRLTSTDPLTPDTGTPAAKLYAYTANRPTVTTDPSGECWYIPFSGDSSCPGAGTLRATVGVAEGAYHVGAGIVTAVAHPVRTAHTINDACRAGVNDYGRVLGPSLACAYAVVGKPIVDQLVLAATTCAGTTDRFDHLTQALLSLALLGKAPRTSLRPRTTAYAHYAGDAANGGELIAGSRLGSLSVTATRASASEVRAAEFMAARGNRVVLRDPVGARGAGGTSDLLVDGVQWDVYSPTTSSPSAIVSGTAHKGSQVPGGGVIVDLSGTSVTADQLGNLAARVAGTGSRVGEVILMP